MPARVSALSAEFVEREYNLRVAFPDHPQWFARWAADSAVARSRLDAHLDVRYGSGPKQTMDLFPAANARGTLLFIHGGYWRALDKVDHSFVAPPLVADGIGVAVINGARPGPVGASPRTSRSPATCPAGKSRLRIGYGMTIPSRR